MTTASKSEYTAAELDAKARQAVHDVDGIFRAGSGLYGGWTVCIGLNGAYLKVQYQKMYPWYSGKQLEDKELMIEL